MVSQEKKQSELSVLNDFKNHYEDFPKGRIRKTESPDFIVEVTPRRTVGIELTRLLPAGPASASHRYVPARLSREILMLTIEKKEEKLPIYFEKKLDYIWLIITINKLDNASSLNLPDRFSEWDVTSLFNKIFLFDTGKSRVHILK